MPTQISSLLETHHDQPQLPAAKLDHIAHTTELAGQHWQNPADLGMSRRTFLQLSGAMASTAVFATDYRRFMAAARAEQSPNPFMIGQFTPYELWIMGVNLGNRFGMISFRDIANDTSKLRLLTDLVSQNEHDTDFLRQAQKAGFIQNHGLAESVMERIKNADVPSASNPKHRVNMIKLLRSVLDPAQTELLVAPQVINLGANPDNKLDYIFRRVAITPLQSWGFDKDGNPKLFEDPAFKPTFMGITVDCLAGSNPNFFSDLIHGAEPLVGNYNWDRDTGKFYITNSSGQRFVIHRLPFAKMELA